MLSLNPSLLITILFLISASSLKSASSQSSCHPDDVPALLAVRKSLGSPPSLSTWGQSCCVDSTTCDDDSGGRVTGLLLLSVPGLTGSISPSISRLTALKEVTIYNNPALTGPIPASIGALSNLTSLRIFLNPKLAGPIPTSICDLPSLRDFDLSNNALTGPIPDCFGTKLTRASWIFLDRNRLSGPIPRSLGATPVPTITLSHNLLTGDASFMVDGEKKPLESLDMSYNQLQFDLSPVRFPLRLHGLDLSNNRIYGRIPTQISKLGRLAIFNISGNDLCGPIPTAGFFKSFDASCFSHNKCLCGGPLKPCRGISSDPTINPHSVINM